MGVEVQTFTDRITDLEIAGNSLADDLLTEKGFSIMFKGWTADGYAIKLKKSGFLRQFSGLVYTFDILLQRHDNVVIVKVDDGDIRNQLVSLGVAAFIVWPVLITAGYGWMKKGDLRKEVLMRASLLFA